MIGLGSDKKLVTAKNHRKSELGGGTTWTSSRSRTEQAEVEESAAGQPVGLRKGDPGLNNSFSIRQFNTYIVGSPRDGHILSWINCFLSRACNLSRHCGHDWCLCLLGRENIFCFTAGFLLFTGIVHLVFFTETPRRKRWRGEKEEKKPQASHVSPSRRKIGAKR